MTEEQKIELNTHFYFVLGDDDFFATKLAYYREAGYKRTAGSEGFQRLWRRTMSADGPEHVRVRVLELIDEMFGMVAEKLATQPFLGGDSPGVDDIMFAGHARCANHCSSGAETHTAVPVLPCSGYCLT